MAEKATGMTQYANLFELTGRRALVVGAGGIGREVVAALAAHHCRLVVADIDHAVATDAAGAVDGMPIALDITDSAQVEAAAGSYPVDILVVTAGMNVRKRLDGYSDAEFDRVVNLNLRGTFNLIRAFGPAMAERGGGSFVAFSSIRASVVEPGQGVYGATKAGLQQLLRAAAAEFGPQSVRFNAIAPGVVETPLTTPIRADAAWERAYASKPALGRWARPGEIVGAAVFLASDAASYVTGSVLYVDGGWTAVDGRFDPLGPSY